MIHIIGEYNGYMNTVEGETILSFVVSDDAQEMEELEKLVEKKVIVEVKRFNEKRSLNANAYFWKLCDEIATVLGSTKDIIYLLLLRKAGQWTDLEIPKGAYNILGQSFRDIEVLAEDEERMLVRCYLGSSHYDTAQMSKLINEAVFMAKEQGIDTWSNDEIERLLSTWKPYSQ